MSSAAKEKKRAADRETQRLNRARTKAHITQLERTIQDLTGPNSPQNLPQTLAQQQEKINNLQDTLRKIGILVQNAATSFPPSSVSDDLPVNPPYSSHTPTENGSLASNRVSEKASAAAKGNFLGIDLACSDRERNYLAELGGAMTMIQDCSFALAGSMMLMSKLYDDNFCIRAVIEGWKDTRDQFGSDIIWDLIQAIDEGLYYRADPVTRIAIIRIMRSLMLQRLGMSHDTSSIPQYMLASTIQTNITHQPFLDFFPWPEFRDQWIIGGTDYANELCAASFSARIRFQWPFEVRDVFHKQVLTGILIFSGEFEKRYHELASWRLDSECAT